MLSYQPFVQRLAANLQGRDFVVGDLHGHYDLLIAGLEKVAFDSTVDRLFSVGDLIDRGPDSALCLRLLDEPWFFAVMGNHEWMMLHHDAEEGKSWFRNGGDWWFTTDKAEQEALCALVEKLPTLIVVGEGPTSGTSRFQVVHAELYQDGVITDVQLDALDNCPSSLAALAPHCLWGRSLFESRYRRSHPENHPGLSPTYVGHSLLSEPLWLSSHCYIDSGAYRGGPLTLVEVSSEGVKHACPVFHQIIPPEHLLEHGPFANHPWTAQPRDT